MRNLLEVFRGIRLVENSKEFVRRILGCLDRVESCEEFVRSIQRYSIEMKAVRNFVEELRIR